MMFSQPRQIADNICLHRSNCQPAESNSTAAPSWNEPQSNSRVLVFRQEFAVWRPIDADYPVALTFAYSLPGDGSASKFGIFFRRTSRCTDSSDQATVCIEY